MAKKRRITNRVRELRELHGGVTQSDLGDAIGVTRQTIIAIEQDRYSPSHDNTRNQRTWRLSYLRFKTAEVRGAIGKTVHRRDCLSRPLHAH